MNLSDPIEIKGLKEAFEYSFKGPKGQETLRFLEQFCGFWKGGPADADDLTNHVLQYERGRRDVILTIKTIANPEWNPEQIAETFKRSE